jgi:hypothetical protein
MGWLMNIYQQYQHLSFIDNKTKNVDKPSRTVMKKKRIWTKLKSGLFGWKVVSVPSITPSKNTSVQSTVILANIEENLRPLTACSLDGSGENAYSGKLPVHSETDIILNFQNIQTMDCVGKQRLLAESGEVIEPWAK